ncbi:MAG: DMT family transporter [Acidobacteriota bacterium]
MKPQLDVMAMSLGIVLAVHLSMNGKVVGGLAMSHFGVLGSPLQPVSATHLVGAAVMTGGVLLATRNGWRRVRVTLSGRRGPMRAAAGIH